MVEKFLEQYQHKIKSWMKRQVICDIAIALILVLAVYMTMHTPHVYLVFVVGAISFLASGVSNFKVEFGSFKTYTLESNLNAAYTTAKKKYDKAVQRGESAQNEKDALTNAEHSIMAYVSQK